MRNSIQADIIRILKKKSYIIMTIIMVLIYVVTMACVNLFAHDYSDLVNIAVDAMIPLLVGIPVFTAVFSDDFNSKAMQTVIGFGLSRKKLVLARFFELIIIFVQVYVVFSIVVVLVDALTGCAGDIPEQLQTLWGDALLPIMSATFSMIMVYAMQSAILGLVAYIVLIMKVISTGLAFLTFIPAVGKLGINPSCFMVDQLITDALENGHPIKMLYAFLGYVVAPLILTMFIFEKKELEF